MSVDIQMTKGRQFDLSSKTGNSLKDNQLKIKRHIEHISGKKFDLKSYQQNQEQELQQKIKSHKMKEIHDKLYKLDSWLSPEIDNNDYHKSIEQENKVKFQKNFKDFQRQIANQEVHDYTNELIDKIKKQKKTLLDQLQQGKKLNLRELFQGQRISDPSLNYRLQKKIQYIENKIQKMMLAQESNFDQQNIEVNTGQNRDNLDNGGSTKHSNSVKSPQQRQQYMRQMLNRNLDKVLKIFEERDVIFDGVSRIKMDRIERKLKVGPPLGQYTPKYDYIDSKIPNITFNKQLKLPFFQQQPESNYENFSDQLSNLQIKNGSYNVQLLRHQNSVLSEDAKFQRMGSESPEKHQAKLTQNSFIDFQDKNNSTAKSPFHFPISHSMTRYSQNFNHKCARSLISREQQNYDGSQTAKMTPRLHNKLIPNFERKGSRKIIVGARDVNEKRFSFKPDLYFDKVSNYKKLPSCNISFSKQVYRDGFSLTKPQTTASGKSYKNSARHDRSASLTFNSNGFGPGSQQQGSSLPPGYYNPNYSQVEQQRGDKNIRSWDQTQLKTKAKLDVTKQIKKKDEVISIQAMMKEDEHLITSIMNKHNKYRSNLEQL
eukprot:403362533